MKKIIAFVLMLSIVPMAIPLVSLAQNIKTEKEITTQIYPYRFNIEIISPNGGEVWKKGETREIKWGFPVPIPVPMPNPISDLEDSQSKNGTPYPLQDITVSIDLYRLIEDKLQDARSCSGPKEIGTLNCPTSQTISSSEFVKHIGEAKLYEGVYSWKIDNDIKDGSDYVIRIETESLKFYSDSEDSKDLRYSLRYIYAFDESNNPFTIKGNATPDVPDTHLEDAIKIIEKINEKITGSTHRLLNFIIAILRELAATI